MLPEATPVIGYRLRHTSITERYPAGAVPERDSSSTVADITILLTRSGDSSRIQIQASNFGHIPGDHARPQQPYPESAVLIGATATRARVIVDTIPPVTASSSITCQLSQSSRMLWLKLQAITIPARLQTGQKWQDTITVSGCVGRIPATFTSKRFYQVTGILSQNLIQLERTDSLQLEGTSPLGGRLVSVTGQGHGATSVELDVRSGAIASSRGSYETSLIVEASGNQTSFVQRVENLLTKTSGN